MPSSPKRKIMKSQQPSEDEEDYITKFNNCDNEQNTFIKFDDIEQNKKYKVIEIKSMKTKFSDKSPLVVIQYDEDEASLFLPSRFQNIKPIKNPKSIYL